MYARSLVVWLFTSLVAVQAFGQGVLISQDRQERWRLPRPIVRPPQTETSYKIKEISIRTRVQDQIARTQVTQSFVNTGNRQMEVSFVFPLPYDGAIDRLTFMVDGKEYDAELMTKEKAREIYEGYMRRNKDPALLEWMGTGMFKTSVFPIPPGAERSVTLRYTQLLRKHESLTDYLFPLSTAKYTSHAIEKLSFNVAIECSAEIKIVYSPTHDVTVKRDDDLHAVVTYEAKNVIPSNDFRLFFDTAKQKLGASLLSYWPEDADHGYFLLLASPEISAPDADKQPKTTILVLDRSGSMNGKKIEQAKEALKFVVNNLNDGDLFNIIAYDSEIESFRPELRRFNDATRKEAIGFVNGIFAGGSTNIDGALSTAMSLVQDSSQPSYIVFLTDGIPTAGVRNESQIVKNTEQNNKYGSRLVSFGVGYDVNSRLIDRLSRANRGQSEFVRPDEDIEAHVSRLYQSMSAPVMVNVQTTFELDVTDGETGSPVNRVYPKEIHDIFAGQQVTMVGRYGKSGAAKIKFTGQVRGDAADFEFPALFVEKSGNETYGFVEKLWASRRIGQIIDELDLNGSNQELITELVSLSTKHGIITPYTSFLADDQATPQQLTNRRRLLHQATDSLESLSESQGRGGFAQRLSKKAYQEAMRLPQANSVQLAEQLSAPSGANATADRLSIVTGTAVPAADGTVRFTDSVIHAGEETIYRRGKLLIVANASDVDIEKDKNDITEITRFDDAYFDLIAKNTKSDNLVLAQQKDDEELLIRLRGTVYLIK